MTIEPRYTYRICIDQYSDEDGAVVPVYGIEVWNGKEPLPQYTIRDLFTLREKAEELAALCNSLDVDPAHLAYIAEDALLS